MESKINKNQLEIIMRFINKMSRWEMIEERNMLPNNVDELCRARDHINSELNQNDC